ncbi:MAG: hypothetical protein C5S48_08165 [Candidatus Methanogaster sp.]|nr:MAG: hypothetical protein C5S48_08165 [ANME-2 cluster archaeon]
MKLKTVGILILSLFCCLLIFASCVYGIGIGVNPAKMEFEIGTGENVQKNITVSNPESAELGYQVYIENRSIDWIKISDPEFSLEPHQKKQITVQFTPTADEVGEFDAKICVVTLKPGGGFNIGSGVKIPVHITIEKSAIPFYTNHIIIVLIMSGLLIILLYVRRLRRS